MSLSFIQSGFLIAGACAAALPILIHLLLRQRARMLPIGSVRFLKSVIKQHTRRRRIRQWILLAMRVLVVLLLASLFARPYWDRSALHGLNREVAILIDGSASMRLRSEEQTVFDRAVGRAREELRLLDENTKVHLAVFDASDVREVDLEDLSDVDSRLTATDYGSAMAWARDLMTLSTRATKQVILITDLQQSGLGQTSLEGLPSDVDLAIRDVGRAMSENLSLEHAAATVTEIRPKEPVRVSVRLHNAGAVPVQDVTLVLELEGPAGRVESRQQVTIAGGDRTSVDFRLGQIERDGVYSGLVRIDRDDDLEFDNQRFVAFEARHPDRLLLVDGQRGRSVYSSETYYLETTLRLRAQPGESPLRSFEVERIIWEDGEGFPSLAGFRAIVMANPRRLSDGDLARLHSFLAKGGNLLFFFGDQTTPLQVNALKEWELFPGALARDATLGPWRVDFWESDHPILLPFQDPQQGDLRTLTFKRMLEVLELEENARPLISSEGQPLLIETTIGKGTALFCTTAADREWSDWPQSRLYVPLVRQMVAYLTSQLTGRQAVVQQLSQDAEAGLVQQDGQLVVRNVDPRESQLQRTTEDGFREAFGLGERDEASVLADLTQQIPAPKGAERPDESWDKVAWLLLALLVAELFLAGRVHA